jgi:hypothetical protein
MFIISQYILKQSKMIPDLMTMTTYSVVSGIVIYASLYAYILLYHKSLLPFFNKIIAYVVGIDVLLSMIYYYTIMNSQKSAIPDDKDKVNELDIDNDSGSYTDSDGSDADSDVDSESDAGLDNQTFNQEDLDQNMLKNEFQNVEASVNLLQQQQQQMNADKITQVSASQQDHQVSSLDTIDTIDKKITNDENNLLNNLINQLNNVNTTVTINDNNINVINDTNESVQTIKRRKRRTKKEIEQDLLTKTVNKTSDLNNIDMNIGFNDDNSE